MEGLLLPERNRGILGAGTGMEGFYSYRNGMEGLSTGTEWRDSSCRALMSVCPDCLYLYICLYTALFLLMGNN